MRYFSFFWVALRPSCERELPEERLLLDVLFEERLDDRLRLDELPFELPELELFDRLRFDFVRLEPPDLLFCCAMRFPSPRSGRSVPYQLSPLWVVLLGTHLCAGCWKPARFRPRGDRPWA